MSINGITASLLTQPWLNGQGGSALGASSVVSPVGIQLPSSVTASQDSAVANALALLGQPTASSPGISFSSSQPFNGSLSGFSALTSVMPTGTAVGGTTASSESLSSLVASVTSLIQNLGPGSSATGLPVASSQGAAPSPVLGNSGTQNAQLNKNLQAIAADPDGSILMDRAKQLGISIEVGDPGQSGQSGQAGLTVQGVTLVRSDGRTRIIVRDPNNIKTIAHELVHAVSSGDGNSKQEEGIADVIGSRIANRLGGSSAGGLSGSDEQIYLNKQKIYPNLQASNAIRQTLAGLGLRVTV
jgi:hypothetical protein